MLRLSPIPASGESVTRLATSVSCAIPGRNDENFALAKHLFFTERFSGELRMEYYNVLNRMQVCGSGSTETNVSNGAFGIDSQGSACQGNTPRQGQATFKLQW